MSLNVTSTAVVGAGGTSTALGQLLGVSGTSNPAYLVVDAFDRAEYTAGASGATGTLTGGGQHLGLSWQGGDGRGAGLVFTWNAATAQYTNASFGNLSALTYTMSSSAHDVTDLAVYGTSSLAQAQADAASVSTPITQNSPGLLGCVTFVTDPSASAPPTQATPQGIAAVAQRYAGQAWNSEGCWVLASTIAAEAGASLPVQSTAVGIPSTGAGEWTVVYDGPVSSNAGWQSLVSTGDIISFANAGGGSGHITTCVSGSGATAMLVDNITYLDASGRIANSAHDGSAADVLIASPHAASQEFNGVSAGSVVIYALDTPAVTDRVTSPTVNTASTTPLANWFAASDPAHRAITQYQVYLASGSDTLTLNGQAATGASATAPVSAASLSSLALQTGTNPGTDVLEVRAQNGSYWGDWQSLTVTVAKPVPLPPMQLVQIASQTWRQGQVVNLALPALFRDPQGQTLTYAASAADGSALPSWLHFDPATRTLSGTVPTGIGTLSLAIKATDTAGLSAAERFAVNIPAMAPILAHATPTQNWTAGQAVNFSLAANTFTDPQGQALTLAAVQSNGTALPAWLHFDPSTATLSGTAPTTPQNLSLRVIATDTSHLSVYELFTASIVRGTAGLAPAGDWTSPLATPPTPWLPPTHAGAAAVRANEPAPSFMHVWHHA